MTPRRWLRVSLAEYSVRLANMSYWAPIDAALRGAAMYGACEQRGGDDGGSRTCACVRGAGVVSTCA